MEKIIHYYLNFDINQLKKIYNSIDDIEIKTKILDILGFTICPNCDKNHHQIYAFCSQCGFSIGDNLRSLGYRFDKFSKGIVCE